jgi:RNA polymerase sigma-70 factor (ECF subfamily)
LNILPAEALNVDIAWTTIDFESVDSGDVEMATQQDGDPGPDIAALTGAMKRGDEEAYRRFCELFLPRLLRYLLVLARGDEESAREVLQQTLVRVARHVRRFHSEAAFWSWLTVLARSAFVDHQRKTLRHRSLLERFFALRNAPPDASGTDSEGRFEECVRRALTGLAEEDRALIDQKYFGRCSVKEIAARDGATEKSVESRLVRIRRQLKNRILKELNDETKP